MTAENQDFEVWQGDDKILRITVTDPEAGGVKDLTGVQDIEWALVDGDGAKLIEKELSGDIEVAADPTTGEFTVPLFSAETQSLDPGYYDHEADVRDAGGDNVTVTTGTGQVHESHV